jgi:hypothetical protein
MADDNDQELPVDWAELVLDNKSTEDELDEEMTTTFDEWSGPDED